jgi:hypothetical protein
MNTIFVLILFAHVVALGPGNSNALTVAEFTSQERCHAAGKAAKKLVSGTVRQMEYACVQK